MEYYHRGSGRNPLTTCAAYNGGIPCEEPAPYCLFNDRPGQGWYMERSRAARTHYCQQHATAIMDIYNARYESNPNGRSSDH